MLPIRVVVAEDEAIARAHLLECLKLAGDVDVVAVCEDGRAAALAIERLSPDVVFLDINMPFLNGIGVGAIARAGGGSAQIVFTTAHENYALTAIDLEATDYVLKPFDAARVAVALARIKRRSRSESNGAPARVLLRSGGRIRIVDIAQINAVLAEGDYCVVSMMEDTMMVRDALKDLEQRLIPLGFVRIHRRVLVNLQHVVEIRPWKHGDHELVLSNGAVYQSGPSYRTMVQNLMHRTAL